jgi:HPt (histidine-containing phosphotransfer) domain-containing protein
MQGDQERFLEAGMDTYIAKPIRPDTLFLAIENLLPAPVVAERSVPTQAEPAPAFNLAQALASVDGDMALLKELAEVFVEACPGLLAAIPAALANGDSQALMRAAHALRGTVGTFAAQAASDMALQLEMMGKNGELHEAHETYVALEAEVQHLTHLLARLGR